MQRCRRTIFLVDREVQGALMVRTVLYWLFCLLSISLLLICWTAYTTPARPFAEMVRELYVRYAPALAASLVLLPLVLMDVARVSNRFVGPVVRLRQGLRDVAEGQPAVMLNFRDDDFWRELAHEFNRAAARISRDGAPRTSPTEEMAQSPKGAVSPAEERDDASQSAQCAAACSDGENSRLR